MISFYKHLRSLLAALLVISAVGVAVVTPSTTLAAPVEVLTTCRDVDGDGDTTGDNESKVCRGVDKNSLFGLITSVINVLLIVSGIIAVIMVIVGGIRYTTSAGDAGQTKSARDTVIYAVVGLVIAIMSFAIVNFVLARI